MLALDLFELLDRGLKILPLIQQEKTFIVELVGGLVRRQSILVTEQAAAGAKWDDEERDGKKLYKRPMPPNRKSRPQRTPEHRFKISVLGA
jgi:hypothetical protein